MYKYDFCNKILKYFKGMCCLDNNKFYRDNRIFRV